MGRLDGKVAVVMGASGKGSMGQATARRFVEEGAKVIVAARRPEPLEALAAEIGAVAVPCDISKDEQIEALARAAVDKFGRVDVAVNFAGINVQSPIAQIDAAVPALGAHLAASIRTGSTCRYDPDPRAEPDWDLG